MAEILMITAIAGAENCAAMLSRQFQMSVETVSSRKDALAALRHREYLLMIVDESLLEPGDEPSYDGADTLFKHAGLAIPLEINFAISGYGRLVRAVRAALCRREQEREVAARAAAGSLQNALRERVADLLLHAQLAQAEPALTPALADKLRVIVELAAGLRQSLADLPTQTEPSVRPSFDQAASLVPALQRAIVRSPITNGQSRKLDDPVFLAMRHRNRPAPRRSLPVEDESPRGLISPPSTSM
jgi:hypothetical protein